MIPIQPVNRRCSTPATDPLPRARAVLISLGLLVLVGGCAMMSPPAPRTDAAVDGQEQVQAQRSPRLLAADEVLRLPPVAADINGAIRGGTRSAIRLVSHDEPIVDATADGPTLEMIAPGKKVGPKPMFAPGNDTTQRYPIDLSNALALGGASHLQIELARERVFEAQARFLAARALWLPSLRLGIGWNKHDGRLQETAGSILKINRNSLFIGGGAGLGTAPLTAGASGPARLFVNLSLADAIFEPLVADRAWDAQSAAEEATFNNSLLEIALAYLDLVEAQGLLANTRVSRAAADEMVKLTALFAQEGAGSQAEVDRATAERAHWQQARQNAQRQAEGSSIRLVRLLQLDANLLLVPVEDQIVPIELVDAGLPREQLVDQGLASRPELVQYDSLVDAALERVEQEQWRPWLPNVQVGASGGTFGGGPGSTFEGQSGRGDVDLLAVWEMRNLGMGNAALRQQRSSQLRQVEIQLQWLRDQIIAEIVMAAGDVASYRQQIDSATSGVAAASESYRRNFQRVRQGEGLPIELLQAIRARAAALDAYTKAVSDYNRAQFRLLRALGQPPSA